jgi:methionine-rich copper-binding protein CopC
MNDERIIAYLLKELPDEDLERFEDECFAQESWPTQIELVEEDLIDAYLRRELTPERRRRFEESYLITEARQERVSIAAALLRHIDERNAVSQTTDAVPMPEPMPEPTWAERFRAFWSRQNWALRAATAIAVIVIVAGVWGLIRTPSPRTVATLTLTISHSNRAEGAQIGQIKLPPDAASLKVSLTLPQPSPAAARYRVELENENGEKKPVEVAGLEEPSVLVIIPAAQLARGQYVLKLFAIQADGTEQRVNGSYFFVVQ